jgi:hypothetical protein
MPSNAPADQLHKLFARQQISGQQFRAAQAFKRAGDRTAAEAAIARQCGQDGLSVVRAVLDGASLEAVAVANGARGVRERQCFGWLFRRGLDVLALKLGFR